MHNARRAHQVQRARYIASVRHYGLGATTQAPLIEVSPIQEYGTDDTSQQQHTDTGMTGGAGATSATGSIGTFLNGKMLGLPTYAWLGIALVGSFFLVEQRRLG